MCSVSRRKRKIMTDQMSVPPADAWARGLTCIRRVEAVLPKCARTVCATAAHTIATSGVKLVVVALLVGLVGVLVAVGVVCSDSCAQSAVQCATAVLGRVGRARGRHQYTSAPPFFCH